jgi:nitrous oxidase accessory protein
LNLTALIGLSQAAMALPSTIEVCQSCEMKSISEAVRRASPGDVILVSPGLYREHDIVVDKALKIRAKTSEKPIVDIEKQGSGFLIQADDVEIGGFSIRNSGFSYTEEMAGIKISNAKHGVIEDNELTSNAFGIYLAQSGSFQILRNKIEGTHLSESLSGNGIHIWNSEDMTIEGNQVSRNRDGIYFEFVRNSSIRKNISIGNLRYGLHFMYSSNNEYRENTFRNNECGVAVMYSHGVRMFRNRFEKSHGPSSYGILLKDISDSFVGGNLFFEDTVGILLDGTTRTDIEGNLFKDDGWALKILGDTDSNKITKNDFIGNTFDVATNAGSNQNTFVENYWDRYRGLDLKGGGIGDQPFRPVRLSSVLIQNYQASLLLIDSLFFTVLDNIENALPSLTPETFKDARPLMVRATML